MNRPLYFVLSNGEWTAYDLTLQGLRSFLFPSIGYKIYEYKTFPDKISSLVEIGGERNILPLVDPEIVIWEEIPSRVIHLYIEDYDKQKFFKGRIR